MANKYKVIDDPFNQANYPDLIGKVLDTPPAYAKVQLIKDKISMEDIFKHYQNRLMDDPDNIAETRLEDFVIKCLKAGYEKQEIIEGLGKFYRQAIEPANNIFNRAIMKLKKIGPYAEKKASKANWYKIAKKMKDVSLTGKLKQTDDGFVYLDINEDIVTGLFSLIDEDKIIKPPYHLKKYNSIGAHISVIDNDEIDGIDIKEIGKDYNFTLGEFLSTIPDGWDGVDKVYFLNVYSDELEKLRKKYGLSKKMKGHEFHITIAIEKG